MTTKASITKSVQGAGSLLGDATDISKNELLQDTMSFAKNKGQELTQQAGTLAEMAMPSAAQLSAAPGEQNVPRGTSGPRDIHSELKQMYEQDMARKAAAGNQAPQVPAPEEKPVESKDYDAEPHGFDHSDKHTILGTIFSTIGEGILGTNELKQEGAAIAGAIMGIPDLVMGAAQLAARTAKPLYWAAGKVTGKEEQFAEAADAIAGGMTQYTGWYDRNISRSKLASNARAMSPLTYEIGKMTSNIAATGPILKALGLAAKGEAVTGSAAKALEDVVAAHERIGGAGSAGKAFAGAIKNAAAKSIVNATKTTTPLTIAKWIGEGVAFNQLQFDPENNHYIASDIIAGGLNLIFNGAGKFVSSFASPLARDAELIKNQFGIILPIKPIWEKIARWLPFTGYGKLMKGEAGKIGTVAGKIEGAAKISDIAIQEDLSERAASLASLLQDEKLSYRQRGIYEDELKALKLQQEQIGTTPGYSQYLYGVHKDALQGYKKETEALNSKIYEKLKGSPNVDTSRTFDEASRIAEEEEGVLKSQRRTTLVKTTEDILSAAPTNGPAEKLRMILNNAGVKNPTEGAEVLEDFLSGKLYKENPDLDKLLRPSRFSIMTTLEKEGLPTAGVDKKDIAELMDSNIMSHENLRRLRTRIGQKWADATNSYDKGKFGKLYGALTQDYEDHVLKYGDKETVDTFRKFNQLYHDKIKPLEHLVDEYSGQGAKAIDTFIGKFLKPDQPNTINEVLKLMPAGDARAKLALKAAITHEAYQRAFIDGIGLNPVKFINSLIELGKTNNVIFSKEEIGLFDGYKKLVNYVSKISPDALIPGLAEGVVESEKRIAGVHLSKGALGAFGVGGALAAKFIPGTGVLLPLIMTASAFTKFMISEKGRNLMLGMAKLGEKSKAITPQVREIFQYLGLYPVVYGAHKFISAANKED